LSLYIGQKNNSTPIKPLEISFITHKENEEMHNNLFKLEDQFNDLSVRKITSDELVKTQRKVQEMQNKMDEMKKSIKSIETILLQRISKRDMEIQGNHENKENTSF